MSSILEIACFNFDSAIIAEQSGADRIELCENYELGGITPSQELISKVTKHIQIPVQIIIRPRGGNFVYNDSEIKQMMESIRFCKTQNVSGVVLGCLSSQNTVDESLCEEMLEEAFPLALTFHRAIDVVNDIEQGIKALISCGFERVLSSGSNPTAFEGKHQLKMIQEKFTSQIEIMPGGGIRSINVKELMDTTKCTQFHSAALLSGSHIADANEIRKLKTLIQGDL